MARAGSRFRGGTAALSETDRHTRFLLGRLAAMGVRIERSDVQGGAIGWFALSALPFETLEGPLQTDRAHFYTLGHNRLKLSSPTPFFDLAPLDVSRCETGADLESALRRAWAAHVRELQETRAWLQKLGAETRLSQAGTRLSIELTGVSGPPALVRSRTEVQLPSTGELRERSPRSATARVYRPPAGLEHAAELELAISAALDDLALRSAPVRRTAAPSRTATDPGAERTRRVLALAPDAAGLAAMETALRTGSVAVDGFREARQALRAFRSQTYDLVLADVRIPRMDGLEFTARLRETAGIEKLPIVLVDGRANRDMKEAARAAGASAYLEKPTDWSRLGSGLIDLLEHGSQRRFVRYRARLPVAVEAAAGPATETTQQVARGGLVLHSRRSIYPGQVERYRVSLPRPLPSVYVEAMVASRSQLPGGSTSLLGVRLLQFLDDSEPYWIRLIEELAEGGAEHERRARS